MPNFSLSDDVFRRAAELFPTPFHLYDEAGMREAAQRVARAFSWAGDFREYFAVKALPNPQVLNIFLSEGCGLDCSSATELLLAERLGARGEDIMFSANAMPPGEFELARKLNAVINLDDVSDIDILQAHGGVPDTVCVRFNPGGDFSDANCIMGSPGESKYGWTRAQLAPGLRKLKRLGVRRFGLHAMLASNMNSDGYYAALAELLFRTGKETAAEAGLPLRFVNLSGGMGIAYRPGETQADIALAGRRVETLFRESFGDPGAADVGIRTEMGRYMSGPYGWLVTRAVHEKRIHKRYIGVDACAVHLLRPAMYGAYHHIHVVGKRDQPATETCDVTGCLCENNDKFAVDRELPPVGMGDLLVIHDAGAHAHAMGYQYNGRLRGAEVLRGLDGSLRLIRRAETPEDYFATLLWPGEGPSSLR